MNIKNLIQLGLNFFPKEKEKITNALNMAEQMIGNREVRTAEDAINLLKEKGVGPEAINKIEKMADSPMARALLNATGLRKEDILADLNRLKNGYTATPVRSTPYSSIRGLPQKDDLAVFRSGLKQFKK